MQEQLGHLRHFIALVNSGEVFDLAGARSFVKPLRVPFNANMDRGIHENLDKLPVFYKFPHHLTFGTEGRNEATEHDEACLGHELGDFAHPPYVLDAISLGKAEILAEPLADIVAIEHECVDPA